MTTFVGVDLAWSEHNASGLAVAEGSETRAQLVELTRITQSFESTAQWITDRAADNHCVVAIDAPLVVSNESGMRDCERALSAVYRAAWAGTHSSSRTLFGDGGPPALARALERHGFRHAVNLELLREPGRWMIEVYPHPALVRLFGLKVRLAYKKGSVDEKRAGLEQLLALLGSLAQADPSLDPGAVGQGIGRRDVVRPPKALEDQLDAWLCTYIALHSLRWLDQRNDVFGTEVGGYIVVPNTPLDVVPIMHSNTTQPLTGNLRPRGSRTSPARTTVPGFVNRNRQTVLRDTGRPGTDHGQRVYAVCCGDCGSTYGVMTCSPETGPRRMSLLRSKEERCGRDSTASSRSLGS